MVDVHQFKTEDNLETVTAQTRRRLLSDDMGTRNFDQDVDRNSNRGTLTYLTFELKQIGAEDFS